MKTFHKLLFVRRSISMVFMAIMFVVSGCLQRKPAPISDMVKSEIAASIGGLQSRIGRMSPEMMDSSFAESMLAHLRAAGEANRQGRVCTVALEMERYLAYAQRARTSSERGAAEALYNAGRMIRYRLLAEVSDNSVCAGSERFGLAASAVLRERPTDVWNVKAAVHFGEPLLFTE